MRKYDLTPAVFSKIEGVYKKLETTYHGALRLSSFSSADNTHTHIFSGIKNTRFSDLEIRLSSTEKYCSEEACLEGRYHFFKNLSFVSTSAFPLRVNHREVYSDGFKDCAGEFFTFSEKSP